jgi:hypothetical protein
MFSGNGRGVERHRKPRKKCAHTGCKAAVVARRMCWTHYNRFRAEWKKACIANGSLVELPDGSVQGPNGEPAVLPEIPGRRKRSTVCRRKNCFNCARLHETQLHDGVTPAREPYKYPSENEDELAEKFGHNEELKP